MGIDLIMMLGSGILTTIAGLIATMIFRKRIEQENIQKKNIEFIAEAVSAKASEARSNVIAALASKLPEGRTLKEIEQLLQSSINIGGDLIITQADSEEGNFIQDLVNSYHQQALSQAKVQFWFSVFAATIGFIFILYSSSSITVQYPSSFIKIMPGVIIDAVALLFFRQAEQTRERATALYDRLRSDNQMLKSQSLVESIEDIQIRSAVKAQIALHMAGLRPKEIDLPTFMSPNGSEKHISS
ncbi:MAG: hypothetical protein HZB23_03500 [Deltaproteobacteria bacterium]|nr:hypothetical protein [Deltaproteobacteria bacterium]